MMNRREFLTGQSAKTKRAGEAIGNDDGATAIEYGLIGGIMGVALIAALPKVAKAQRQNLKCVKRAMTGREQTRFCKKRGA